VDFEENCKAAKKESKILFSIVEGPWNKKKRARGEGMDRSHALIYKELSHRDTTSGSQSKPIASFVKRTNREEAVEIVWLP
jgi:hypothetical protein